MNVADATPVGELSASRARALRNNPAIDSLSLPRFGGRLPFPEDVYSEIFFSVDCRFVLLLSRNNQLCDIKLYWAFFTNAQL